MEKKTLSVRIPFEIPMEEITTALATKLGIGYILVDGGVEVKYDEEKSEMYYKNNNDPDEDEYWKVLSERDQDLIKALALIGDEMPSEE